MKTSGNGFVWQVVAACGLLVLLSPGRLAAAPLERGVGYVNWLLPSDGPYPVVHSGDRIQLRVSIERQRVYVLLDGHIVYAMVASTGVDRPADDATPQGTFWIQRERGLSFYSPSEHEGAEYWVSWLHHGEYLFHSVPTDRFGNFIVAEAQRLGQKASHGCIRLTVADAKWVYEHIPYGARVEIGS